MPALVTYERNRLSEAQYQALGVYIARKRLKNEENSNGIEKQNSINEELDTTASPKVSNSPAKPSSQEIFEEKQKDLNDLKLELTKLEQMLGKLKDKKHELFEELKSLVHSKKCEERVKQMQGYPSPFIHHPMVPGTAAMMNIPQFRPGMKRMRPSSPPVVQVYSPLPTPHATFPPLSNRMPVLSEIMNPAYPFQQRDAHLQIQGPRVNPSLSPPPPPGGNQFFLSRPALVTQPPFTQQNVQNQSSPSESVTASNSAARGFSNASSGHSQGYTKRDSHGPCRSRYY